MRAVYVREFGDIEAMELVDLPDPVPGPMGVLVRVRASGINFAETRMRAGTYGGQVAPFVMGMESAGVVEALGEEVTGFTVGQRVFGRARGSHAQKVVFDARHLMPLPDTVSFEEGAAIPVGWLTAWHGLITVANAQPGQTVLIEAVGSSVGSAAAQIARWRGCWVIGTASRDDKVRRAREAGCNVAYNYVTEDVAERVKQDTNGRGVDIALNTVGGATIQSTMDSMADDGKVLSFGSTGGRLACFDLGIGARNIQLLSFSISTSARFLTETMRTFREVAIPLFANGTFKAVVDRVLPLDRVHDAHLMVDQRAHYGKIVLTVD